MARPDRLTRACGPCPSGSVASLRCLSADIVGLGSNSGARMLSGTEKEKGPPMGTLCIALAVQDVDSIDFDGNTFCFTGTFLFGTRSACHRAAEKVGGIPAPWITKKLDYSVVGTMSTRSWANTSFGRKIERAVALQQSGSPLVIIDERRRVEDLPIAASDQGLGPLAGAGGHVGGTRARPASRMRRYYLIGRSWAR